MHRYQTMDREELLRALEMFAKSWLAHDGCWFLAAEERLGLVWREQLTRRSVDLYLSDRTYYRLDSATGIANPDQRIADDVRAFTTTTDASSYEY